MKIKHEQEYITILLTNNGSIQLLMVIILLVTATLLNLDFKQFIAAYSAIMISTYVLLVLMWIAGARAFNPSPSTSANL